MTVPWSESALKSEANGKLGQCKYLGLETLYTWSAGSSGHCSNTVAHVFVYSMGRNCFVGFPPSPVLASPAKRLGLKIIPEFAVRWGGVGVWGSQRRLEGSRIPNPHRIQPHSCFNLLCQGGGGPGRLGHLPSSNFLRFYPMPAFLIILCH